MSSRLRRATLQGVITIRTGVLETAQVAIQIADSDPGMTEEVQRRLIDPFFTTKPVEKGTGLGMAISHQVVTEKHGGSLQCMSAVGQGTVFVITIPIQQSSSMQLNRESLEPGIEK